MERILQPNKDGKHQEREGNNHQEQLEQNGLFKPLCKADVGKPKTYKQSAAGGIQNIGVSIGKEVSQNDYRFADALNGSKREHGDDKNRLCGCARDEELNNQNKRIQNNNRKIRRDVGDGVVEIVEDGMYNIALLRNVRNAKRNHNDDDRG